MGIWQKPAQFTRGIWLLSQLKFTHRASSDLILSLLLVSFEEIQTHSNILLIIINKKHLVSWAPAGGGEMPGFPPPGFWKKIVINNPLLYSKI